MIARKRKETHDRLMAESVPYRRAMAAARYMDKTQSPQKTCATWAKHMQEQLK